MHTYRKWVLTLGIVAATPGLTLAGPLSLFKSKESNEAQSAQSQRPMRSNQQVAESVANVLRIGGLTGYDIDIEYKDGVALLAGKIGTAQQKALAEQMAKQIPEVKSVQNQLVVVQQSPAAPGGGDPANKSALFESSASTATPAVQTASLENQGRSNQAVAEQIAQSVAAGVHGYDIEVRYVNGTATLSGSVANMQERQAAHQLAAAVPGVESVNNRLMVAGGPKQMAGGYPAQAGYGSQVAPAGYQPPLPPGAVPGAVPPPEGAFAAPGTTPPVLNNPSLPPYAWPAYASYPNYAQVTYPQQYSASAWPYIGPFYPYPQVPLGWRQVQLEWDDGSWNLNFRPRTDRWWWFLSPKNW